MQQITPTLEFYGEVLEIARYHGGDGLTGHWLAHKEEEIFVPIESEPKPLPIVH